MPGRGRDDFVIEPSPTPELALEVYSPERHPEFTSMLRDLPSLHGVGDRAAVLTNTSLHPVAALVARWTYLDYRDASRVRFSVWDHYFPLPASKPFQPAERRLLTLNGIHARFDVAKPHIAISGGSGFVHGARNYTLVLDSAVFEGGRLVGHDTHRIAERIHGRYAAMKWLAEQIMLAEAAGESAEPLIAAVLKGSEAMEATEANRWRRRLASLARRQPATAKSWLFLTPPPRFFRQH